MLGASAFGNGGFEDDLAGWTGTGNLDITADASRGEKAVRFNPGQGDATAIVSQSFATISGHSYILSFDYGIFSPVTPSEQQLEVTVVGQTGLLSEVVSTTAWTGSVEYHPQTFSFVADRSITTLSFRDVSQTTALVDSYLDNVQVTAETGPSATPTPAPEPSATPGPRPTVFPAISISVFPPRVSPGTDANFIISTSSIDPNQSTRVYYSMAGSAEFGTDYTLSGSFGQIDIPAGASSANVILHAVAGEPRKRPKRATMKLSVDPSYRLSKKKKAVVAIGRR